MQEGTVGWDPISVRPVFSWQERVFILYCLLVIGIAVVRSINLARQLWFGGALVKGKDISHSHFQFMWATCSSKVVGMKRLSAFTIMCTVLTFADRATNFLAGVATEKQIGIAALAGTWAQIGRFAVLGLMVCALLYGLAALYEGVLARRIALWNASCANQTASSGIGLPQS